MTFSFRSDHYTDTTIWVNGPPGRFRGLSARVRFFCRMNYRLEHASAGLRKTGRPCLAVDLSGSFELRRDAPRYQRQRAGKVVRQTALPDDDRIGLAVTAAFAWRCFIVP